MKLVKIYSIGQSKFEDTYNLQISLFNKLIENNEKYVGYIIFCEHYHVITIGLHANTKNLKVNEDVLAKKNISLIKTDRGGDITYHGFGQLICYPILNLKRINIGPKLYVSLLENSVINTLKEYDLEAYSKPKTAGVWIISKKNKTEKKICSIGIRISKGITLHGLALNVNTDLSYFNFINPCGLASESMTSMANELNKIIPLKEVEKKLFLNILKIFNLDHEIIN